jgi:hypothetical protein
METGKRTRYISCFRDEEREDSATLNTSILKEAAYGFAPDDME